MIEFFAFATTLIASSAIAVGIAILSSAVFREGIHATGRAMAVMARRRRSRQQFKQIKERVAGAVSLVEPTADQGAVSLTETSTGKVSFTE